MCVLVGGPERHHALQWHSSTCLVISGLTVRSTCQRLLLLEETRVLPSAGVVA